MRLLIQWLSTPLRKLWYPRVLCASVLFRIPSLFLGLIFPCAGYAAESAWVFEEVSSTVIDTNPPGQGRMFDFAFIDLNDDHLLDIAINNHDHAKGSPIWLGTQDHRFKFWQNFPDKHVPIAGFYIGETDLDGDGRTDVVYTGNEGGVVFNLNRTGGHKPRYEAIQLKESSPEVSFADFTGDGALEVLVRPGRMYDHSITRVVQTNLHYGSHTVSDFNADGLPDLFSGGERSRRAHWSGPRQLFHNQNGVLKAVGDNSDLVSKSLGGIVRSGDFNHDGHMDIYVFDGKPPDAADTRSGKDGISMKLYLGDGAFGFRDVSTLAGFDASTLRSGYSMVYLADIDNDTHLDIVNEGNYGTQVWRNHGDGSFSMFGKGAIPWAVNAHLRLDDYDMDGRLDVVTAAPGPAWNPRKTTLRLFRNAIQNDNHWLKIILRQQDANTRGIGASVTIFAEGTRTIIGKRVMMCDTVGAHPRLHVGLGRHTRIDIDVRFPHTPGTVRFLDVAADQYLLLRPDGRSETVDP